MKPDFKNKIIITTLLIITFLISILSLNLFATLDTRANAVDSQRIHQYNLDSFEVQKREYHHFLTEKLRNSMLKKTLLIKLFPFIQLKTLLLLIIIRAKN